MLCVTKMMVLPLSRQIRSISRFICSRVRASSAPNGSSIRINFGSWMKARAIAVRCCRSEEHTSELQSLRHLVCRLLLEKKKNDEIQHLDHEHTIRPHTQE